MAQKKDVSFIMLKLGEAYGKEITDDQVGIYFQALQEYPRLVLVHAAANLTKASKWFPRVSEFVQAAERAKGAYNEPDWAKVNEAMYWYLYRHNMSSTDELSDADIQRIYAEAGEPLVEEIVEIPPEFIREPRMADNYQ